MLIMLNKKIILVEDDEKLANQITRFLNRYHYQVEHINDGGLAIPLVQRVNPELVVLDLMLPTVNGLDICRALRPQFKGDILMLTGSDDDIDQVTALEMGVDGYLIKPVQPRVLLAHIRLLERKRRPETGSIHGTLSVSDNNLLIINKLCIHLLQRTVVLEDNAIQLKPAEFEVLKLLAERADNVLSREEILQSYRGIDYDGLDRSIDVKIAALRKKLCDHKQTKIVTIRAKGYMLVSDAWR